ncbi:MAG: hypothetical protein RJB38_1989 [Pseudomonadota bacterium]|jgi:ADP-heptose:LPS heptosyltransferase
MKPFLTRPKKILVIKLRSLGETIVMTAALDALKEAFPETQIQVAVTSTWAPLLIHHPAVSRIWPVDRHIDKLARGRAIARAALRLRSENLNGAVNFHASPSSATLAFATGARVRAIHFHGARDKDRYSTLEIPDKGKLKTMLERDFDAIRALGALVPSNRFWPRIVLKPSEMDEGFRELAELGLTRPVLALGLGASRPAKAWPTAHFAEVARKWSQAGGTVLLITGPGESERAQNVMAQIPPGSVTIASVHAPEIRKLAAILSQCSVFVGNDSGIRHLAAASGLPTVSLFGPEDPQEWSFYPAQNHVDFFLPGLVCRADHQPGNPEWCSLHECVVQNHRCMRGISADQVFEAARKVMR